MPKWKCNSKDGVLIRVRAPSFFVYLLKKKNEMYNKHKQVRLNEINSQYYQSVLNIEQELCDICGNNGRDAITNNKSRNSFLIGYSCRFPAYKLVYDKFRQTTVLESYTLYDERILHLDFGSFDINQTMTATELRGIINRYNVSELMFTNEDLSGYEISPYDFFESHQVAEDFQTYVDYLRQIE